MDVSRIEAISPRQIDWKKLTSKEIIEYDSQGIDVPEVYLLWAKNFLGEVSSLDKDETTYEMANSYKSFSNANSGKDTLETSDISENVEENNSDVNLTAKEEREKMQEEEGLYNTGKAFIATSKENISNNENAQGVMSNIQDTSSDEISALDSQMREIISNIEDLKSKMQNEQNKNDGRNLGTLYKLNQQIKTYGQEGQSILAGQDAELQDLLSTVDGYSGIIGSTIDYGNETISVGEDLKEIGMNPFLIRYYILGKNAVNTGNDAVDKGDNTRSIQIGTQNTIKDDISTVNGYKNEIQNASGVAPVMQFDESAQQNNDNFENSQNNVDNNSEQSNNSNSEDKTIKMASNLDELLKYKIRKGETPET